MTNENSTIYGYFSFPPILVGSLYAIQSPLHLQAVSETDAYICQIKRSLRTPYNNALVDKHSSSVSLLIQGVFVM